MQHTCAPLHVTPHAPQLLLDVSSVHKPVLHWPKLALHWVQEVVVPPMTWQSTVAPRLHSHHIPDSVNAPGRLPHAEAHRLDLDLAWSRFRAVTVVHAPCSTLAFTLTNFAGNLGPDWPLLVVYSPGAEAAVRRCCTES